LFLRTATGTGTDPFDFVLRTRFSQKKQKTNPRRHKMAGIHGLYDTIPAVLTQRPLGFYLAIIPQ